jgi:hypothetical protein
MDVTVHIPDAIAPHLIEVGGDLARMALESVALEALRSGQINEVQLCEMLGLARIQMDGFLKSHAVYEEYTLEDFEEERKALKELNL